MTNLINTLHKQKISLRKEIEAYKEPDRTFRTKQYNNWSKKKKPVDELNRRIEGTEETISEYREKIRKSGKILRDQWDYHNVET